MNPLLRAWLASVTLFAAGCGGDGSPAPAGGSPGGTTGAAGAAGGSGGVGGASAGGPSIPPPAPPVLTPCPERWTAVAVPSGPTVCEPGPLPDWSCPDGWAPETLLGGTPQAFAACLPPLPAVTCPDGAMAAVGTSACRPVGDPCPAGDWPTGVTTATFVKVGATGGDGSMSKPLGSIVQAVTKAPPGSVVAIAKGHYVEAIGIGKTVTLWGACAAGVTIEGPPIGNGSVTIGVAAAGKLTLRNVTVTGPRIGIGVLGGRLDAAGVRVSKAQSSGFYFDKGAIATMTDVQIADTAPAPDGSFGGGVEVQGGTTLKMDRAVIERTRDAAVLAMGAQTQVELHDVLVRDTLPRESDDTNGVGLAAQDGGVVTLQRCLIERSRKAGVIGFDPGTSLSLTDVVVRDTQSQKSTATAGRGLEVHGGASATLVRALFDRNRDVGVIAGSAGTKLALTDVAIRDTASRESDDTAGNALQVLSGATADGLRVAISVSRTVAVIAGGAQASLSLQDVMVVDTSGQASDGTGGQAIQISDGATAKIERAMLERSRSTAMLVADVGTTFALRDAVVRDTRGQESDLTSGRGLDVRRGAVATVDRALFERNHEVAIVAHDADTSLVVTDVVVRDTQPQESDHTYGVGFALAAGTAKLQRAVVSGSAYIGVAVLGQGSRLSMTDTLVQGTVAQVSDGQWGVGLGLASGAQVDVASTRLTGNRGAGVLAMNGSVLTMSSCEIGQTLPGSFTQIGADGVSLDGPHIDGVGDGVLIVGGSNAVLKAIHVSGNARAGILFSESMGSVTAASSKDNAFGLVLQGDHVASYDAATCDFSGNAKRAVLTGGDLPVPNSPVSVPTGPPGP